MVTSNDQGPPWIDTQEFTRTGQRLAGRLPIARLGRMADLLTDQEGPLNWELAGERSRRADGGSDAHLGLAFSARVRMRCVRCLEPVEVPIQDHRHFRLVVTESVAERDDPQTDDVDLLVESPRFDVRELLEDEAIMALPFAPRHADCVPPAGVVIGTAEGPRADPEAEVEGRPNPFAVLAGLKRRPSDGSGEN